MPKFLYPSNKPKSFEKRLRDGEIFDLRSAADITGYNPRHLSRLCETKKVPHIRRNGAAYFFTPAQIEKIFEFVA
ncbi:MAG: hypothetical protein KGL39_25855 [Patescibacteria group bacterium]|nr:hypothetical protein [Patescibacteria group bacterium]